MVDSVAMGKDMHMGGVKSVWNLGNVNMRDGYLAFLEVVGSTLACSPCRKNLFLFSSIWLVFQLLHEIFQQPLQIFSSERHDQTLSTHAISSRLHHLMVVEFFHQASELMLGTANQFLSCFVI